MQSESEDLIGQHNGTRLTINPGLDEHQKWGPDGNKILFTFNPLTWYR